jgi:hypothetical protein
MKKEFIHCHIKPETKKKLKIIAAKKSTNITIIIINLIEKYLENEK